MMNKIRRVPKSKLGVSEPDPRLFGNEKNEPANPAWTNPNCMSIMSLVISYNVTEYFPYRVEIKIPFFFC
jgi:hypothetical protein